MEIEHALSNIERREQLLRLVEQRRRVTIGQICEQFTISPATARRDLDTLAAQGRIQRVHGGAIPVRLAPPEPPVLQRMAQQLDEKQRIGRAAAQLVADGDTVFLSSGTTAQEVARGLLGRKNLTVITNSLMVVNTLIDAPDITIVSLGGVLRRDELSLIGHLTERALADIRADKVIVGIRAVDAEQGLTNQYLPETLTDRAILKIGRQVILVADHTKCGRVATAFLAPLDTIDVLVTDSAIAPEFEAALTSRGIRVIKA